MNKYKVAVYAICKNEEKFVNRWVDSMKEADAIYVLDTGSTDNTVKKLKERGIVVETKIIQPWRFDVARNESLKLVPEDFDICVCTDLDEVFMKGWRKHLEDAWNETATRARYEYHWKLNELDIPLVTFWLDKIHTRKNYTWTHPVHEVLTPQNEENYVNTSIVAKHYPDEKKSRSSYLPLLELSVEESPEDDRNLHYLGREYLYYKEYDKSIATLHRHLACKNATWKDERCASMRFIARCYWSKNYLEEAEDWYKRAIIEAPYLREPYIELANLYEQEEKYDQAYSLANQALEIKEKSKSYINEEFAWNDAFYDLLSLTAFYTKNYQEAVEYVKKAIELNPNESRYQKNLETMLPFLEALHE